MQKFILVVCSALVFSARLDFNTQDCLLYFSKLDVKQYHFRGETILFNSTMIQVNLNYWDEIYFDDPQYFGLVQEDGKSLESTCQDLKIFKFSNNNYAGQVQVSDIKIVPLENYEQRIRSYSFLLIIQELEIRMIKTENSNYYVYKEYYSHAAETNNLSSDFYFEFTIVVKKFNDVIIETTFKSLSWREVDYGDNETIVKWCKVFSCDDVSVKPSVLHFNDEFFLLHILKFGINNDKQKKKGQVKVLIKSDIAWNNFTIIVISKKIVINNKEYLQIYEFVSGYSDLIESIKGEQSEDCLTCQEQCENQQICKTLMQYQM